MRIDLPELLRCRNLAHRPGRFLVVRVLGRGGSVPDDPGVLERPGAVIASWCRFY